MNARFQQEEISGVIDGVEKSHFLVDGDVCRLAKGVQAPGLKPGCASRARAFAMDDRSLEVKEGQVMPAEFEGEEAQFMAAASQEVAQIQRQLKLVKDPELQAYVEQDRQEPGAEVGRPAAAQLHVHARRTTRASTPSRCRTDGRRALGPARRARERGAARGPCSATRSRHVTHRHGFKGYKDQQSKKKWFGLGSLVAGIVVGTQTDSALAGLVTGVGSQLAAQRPRSTATAASSRTRPTWWASTTWSRRGYDSHDGRTPPLVTSARRSRPSTTAGSGRRSARPSRPDAVASFSVSSPRGRRSAMSRSVRSLATT
jgi:hypothetical protein